jgi:hypothetical protein
MTGNQSIAMPGTVAAKIATVPGRRQGNPRAVATVAATSDSQRPAVRLTDERGAAIFARELVSRASDVLAIDRVRRRELSQT